MAGKDLNKIWTRGEREGVHEEGVLDSGNVKPGMAVELKSNGNYDVPASTKTELLKSSLLIALEDTLQGRTTADAYASGDICFMGRPKRGDHMCLLVKSGENIAVDDLIVPEGSGSGKFVEAAGTEARYAAKALEAIGVLAADTLVLCEIQ